VNDEYRLYPNAQQKQTMLDCVKNWTRCRGTHGGSLWSRLYWEGNEAGTLGSDSRDLTPYDFPISPLFGESLGSPPEKR